MRLFEAVLSFKSLFEGVPDHRLSSNFTWLALFLSLGSHEHVFEAKLRKKIKVSGGLKHNFEDVFEAI